MWLLHVHSGMTEDIAQIISMCNVLKQATLSCQNVFLPVNGKHKLLSIPDFLLHGKILEHSPLLVDLLEKTFCLINATLVNCFFGIVLLNAPI